MEKVLLVIGDGGEVTDTIVPYYRLGEDYDVVVAAPEKRTYHLVQHERHPDWDITVESPGYHLESHIAFRDVNPDDYIALVLPGGRAPEFLRYDPDLIRITRDFFAKNKPVASICHGIEILAAADVIRGREVTTIPRCRLDAEFAGAKYINQPLVISDNLFCCSFKNECSAWMKAFAEELRRRTAAGNRR